MNNSSRVVLNTIAQYIKTFFNILFTLYATRVILETLGDDDFGIYTLIAGVVAMLSFITNALSTTTQRYLSYNQGKGDLKIVTTVFCNSLVIHIIIGLLLSILLLALTPFLYNGILNIPVERIESSKIVYYWVVFMLFVTFITTPYRACLISHENIVYLSIIDFLDGLFKVIIAIMLTHIHSDKLESYAMMMFLIQLFNFLAISIYAFIKYEECIFPRISLISRSIVREMGSFAGWNVYSMGCVIGRTQGVAIALNHFLGAAINTAYGLGFQISGYINFLSESLLNALRPQIMKSEGCGDRKKMLLLSEFASKYSFFLLSILAIPCIAEMPSLLHLWLGKIPDNAILFCRMVMLAALMDSLTIGLISANQAIGNVKTYSLVVNTLKLLTLPFVIVCLFLKTDIVFVAVLYVSFEFLCAMTRLPFLSKYGGLDISHFVNNVFCKLIVPLLCVIVLNILCVYFSDFEYRFLLTFLVTFLIYPLLFYRFSMSKDERLLVVNMVKKILRK